ncbi:MAG: hypothetical protein AAF519_18935 [Bacteroidota bacterium]
MLDLRSNTIGSFKKENRRDIEIYNRGDKKSSNAVVAGTKPLGQSDT